MKYDYYSTISQMANYVKKLEGKIDELETNLKLMRDELESMKNSPPMNVERIDYHFDQLKIERLEGTLNIGINPQDLKNLDEFSIGSNIHSPPAQLDPNLYKRIYDELFAYIETDMPRIVEDTKMQFNLQLDGTYTEFIKQDILKQLKGRIEYYLSKRDGQMNHSNQEQTESHIIQSIKKDIQQAVHAFFSQFPRKGEGQNDFSSNQS